MCAMGKENFLARTPPFMGDILWEHLEILQKGKPRYMSHILFQLDPNARKITANDSITELTFCAVVDFSVACTHTHEKSKKKNRQTA